MMDTVSLPGIPPPLFVLLALPLFFFLPLRHLLAALKPQGYQPSAAFLTPTQLLTPMKSSVQHGS